MRKLIKLSEVAYGAGFSIMHPSYLEGFPQRENYLLKALEGWEIIWFKHGKLVDAKTLDSPRAELQNLLEAVRPDVILFDNPVSSMLLDGRSSQATVFDVCDWYLDYYAVEFGRDEGWRLMQEAIGHAISITEHWLFQSTVIKKWIDNLRGSPVENYAIIPNGFDEKIFRPAAEAPLSSENKVILFAGKLGKWYSGLFDVAASLKPDWQLVLVGDGPMRKQLEGLRQVTCLGRQDLPEVARYMNAADVCVMPVDDCSPIATSEYMACGKPVVHKGNRINWLIKDGVNGYVVDNGTSDWSHKIELALNAPQRLRYEARTSVRSWSQLQSTLMTSFDQWFGPTGA